MRRSVAVAAAVVLLGAGVTQLPAARAVPDRSAPAAAPTADAVTVAQTAAFTPKKITWGACPKIEVLTKAKGRCGYLTVPLDYAKPAGTKIKLRVSRVAHTAKTYQGVMLTAPLTPGAGGIWQAAYRPTRAVAVKTAKQYDWIGFDIRGTGRNDRVLKCGGGGYATGYARPDYRMKTVAEENVWRSTAKKYAKKCDAANGALLNHMSTRNTVQDLESLRKALGRKKINFYGFGYSSYIGQAYSSLYPQRIRRMVLDSPPDPARPGYQAILDQAESMDASIKVFFAWMAKYNSKYHLGSTAATVATSYYAQLDALAADPADGLLGPDELTDVFSSVPQNQLNYPYVAYGFERLVTHADPAYLLELYEYFFGKGPVRDRFSAGYYAINCTDAPWPTSWDTWRADAAALNATAPYLTYANVATFLPCFSWGPKAGTPITVDGSRVPAVLLVAETLNGDTPYAGALAVRARYPKARLVEVVGGVRASGSMSGSACVQNAVSDYLRKGTLPERTAGTTSDRRCKPSAAPKPLADTAAAKVAALVPEIHR